MKSQTFEWWSFEEFCQTAVVVEVATVDSLYTLPRVLRNSL